MKTYKQLTRYQRYHIRIYMKAGYSHSKIAKLIRVHKSTISREIRRSKGFAERTNKGQQSQLRLSSIPERMLYKQT